MIFSFGSKKQKSSSKQQSSTFVDPSQQPFLQDVRRNARALYSQGGMPVEGVAAINPRMQQGLDNQFTGGGNIMGFGNNMMSQGQGLMQGSTNALNFSNQAMGSAPGAGAGFAMNSGNQYASGAAGMGAASMNAAVNQGFNQDNLGNYINNDVLQGQIDAASRDVVRNLNENELLANRSMRAGTGGSGNSRGAIMDAIAAGRAADRISDISTAIRAPAYMQGVGIEAARMGQNAAFQQDANQANAGYNQQGDMLNMRAFNDARDFGSQLGGNAFNNNMQNNQFGASLGATLGNQGINNMNTGAQMFGFGNNMQMAAGQYGRDYQQQLLNQQYRQGMSPYQNLEFYNSIIGAPNNLSQATASSKGSSRGFDIGFGKKD